MIDGNRERGLECRIKIVLDLKWVFLHALIVSSAGNTQQLHKTRRSWCRYQCEKPRKSPPEKPAQRSRFPQSNAKSKVGVAETV